MVPRKSYRILTRRAFFVSTAGATLAASLPAANSCQATPSNIEGPYWRANAPFLTNLRAGVAGGEPLVVSGLVLSAKGCAPVAGAVLDVWQADHEGYYDLDRDDSDSQYLRGRVRAGQDGSYRFETIKPAPYGIAGRLRPAHIHFKVSAPGFRSLTTQLYFDGDPNLDHDPLRAALPELTRALRRSRLENRSVLVCEFDIRLRAG